MIWACLQKWVRERVLPERFYGAAVFAKGRNWLSRHLAGSGYDLVVNVIIGDITAKWLTPVSGNAVFRPDHAFIGQIKPTLVRAI